MLQRNSCRLECMLQHRYYCLWLQSPQAMQRLSVSDCTSTVYHCRFKKAKRGRTAQAEVLHVRLVICPNLLLFVCLCRELGCSQALVCICLPLQGTGLFSGISLSLNGTPSTVSSSDTATTALSPPHTVHSKYLEQLRSLNVSVSDWIAKHVRDNPFVDLTPIFRDYETHLKNIDNKVRKDERETEAGGWKANTTDMGRSVSMH